VRNKQKLELLLFKKTETIQNVPYILAYKPSRVYKPTPIHTAENVAKISDSRISRCDDIFSEKTIKNKIRQIFTEL